MDEKLPEAPDVSLVSRMQGTGWTEGDVILEGIFERCHNSAALAVIDELIRRVETMGIASRFQGDRCPKSIAMNDLTDIPLNRLDIIFGNGKKLSEVGHKRATLLIHLSAIRSDFLLLIGKLGQVCLDVEAANMECDGSHVATPSPEERLERDQFQG